MLAAQLMVRVVGDMTDLQKKLQGIGGEIQKSMQAALPASKAVAGGLAAIGAAMTAAAGRGIALAANMEQTKAAFETMLGSGQQAESFIRDLWDFAATTPFEFEGLTDSARQLLAFGFEAEKIVPMMTNIGDAVSALGGGAAEIDRVTRAMGQMQAKGKVSAEEMMQLAELGIPAWEMLANSIGVSIPEAMDMASKGAIDATTGINAILEGMDAKFAGSMQKQSETVLGLWSTLKDTVAGGLLEIGQSLIESFNLQDKLKAAIEWLQKVSDWVREFSDLVSEKGLAEAWKKMVPENLERNLVLIAGAIGGALVPAIYAFATGLWAATVPLLPFIAAGAALAALAYTIYKNWEPIKGFFIDMWTGIKTTVLGVWDSIVKGIKGFVNAIIEAVNFMIRGLNRIHFDVPSWVPGLGGKAFGFDIPEIPEIPLLANGGIIQRPGLAVVGEEGPELVSLSRGAIVEPLDRATGRETVINATFYIYDATDPEKVGRIVRRELGRNLGDAAWVGG